MARRKPTGASKTRKPAPPVIDVGEPVKPGDEVADAPETAADAAAADAGVPDDDEIDQELAEELGKHPVLDVEVADEKPDKPDKPDRPSADRPQRSLARRDPLAIYMAEARRYPILTSEQEHELAVRLFDHNDSAAARRLIEANLRLVVKIAYEFRRAQWNVLDLVQEGNLGLMHAVRKYDPHRGVRLTTYAGHWIRAYILRFVMTNFHLVKIGTTRAQRKLFFNLKKERAHLERLGFQPTTALLAERLAVPEREVVDMQYRLAGPETSLDAPISTSDGGTRTRMDYLPGEEPPADSVLANAEISNLLHKFGNTLEGREAVIFKERLLAEDPATLQQIGERYKLSRERVRQIEARMLANLKDYLEQELGSAVDIAALTRE
jgi:RNA polymerase sigma-32 factor